MLLKYILSTGLIISAGNLALAQESVRDLSFSGKCSGEDSAVISFNGDILIHHHLYTAILPQKSFKSLWIKTQGLISKNKADFAVGNLEGPAAIGIDASGNDRGDVGWIYDARYYENGPKNPTYDKKVVYSGTNFLFNFHPRILSDLKNTGYDLLTLANNHSLDRNSIGIDRTLQAARKFGIATTGTRMSNEKSETDFYNKSIINNIKVAFIGCTESTNGRIEDKIKPEADARYYQVLRCKRDPDKISSMIKDIKTSVDAVVVLPHWGDEYEEEENSKQRAYAREWINAGALAVVGSHPHVLQPWEKYNGKDANGKVTHEGVIMYSLGNFVAGQGVDDSRKSEAKKTGVVTYLGLTKNGSKTVISAVGYTPTHRTYAEISPVDRMDKMISDIVIPKFGTKNFIRPKESLGRRFCR